MSKIDELLNSFENEKGGWMYYGDIDPAEAIAELAALRKQRNDYMEWHVKQGKEIARLRAELAEARDEEKPNECVFCETRAVLRKAEMMLDALPLIGSPHYDDVIANLINDISSANSTFQDYCDELPFTSPDPTPVTKEEIMAGG